MSWQIPTQIEQDIISGKATYRTFQTGNGGQSILPVPPNAYVVIFGYDFSPAGGGLKKYSFQSATGDPVLSDPIVRWFETQQISFYTGSDFYPFIHHVNCTTSQGPYADQLNQIVEEIDNTPIARQIYITSPNDITITVGLILNSLAITQNAIPVTNRTPLGLTYGGAAQAINTQTNYGPALFPLQFMQPSPKDYQDFSFGLLPSNADGQAFATPDRTNGLRDATEFLNSLGILFRDSAACNYYLCLHYALYNKPIDSKQG